jgi:RNA polymerase sigma factor (sigma-70 family)
MTPRQVIEPARLAGTALLHTQTDERLVDLARAGNDRAFEAIVTRYRKPLLRYCSGILPANRAEDAVQQAFLNAYRSISVGEGEMNLKPWLYRIAHNASLNLLRQNGWNYDQIPEDFDGVQQPPQALDQKEHIREVVKSVKDLPERQRNALVLRELEGRSYEEIALALGVTGGSVRQLLNRARTTLRAAATAVTPPHLVARLAERAGGNEPIAARVAELSVGAGAAATMAKVGTALVVAGAVAGGVTGAGPFHDNSGPDTAKADVASSSSGAASKTGEGASEAVLGHGRGEHGRAGEHGGRGEHGRGRDSRHGHRVGDDVKREGRDGEHHDDHGGLFGGGGGDDHSGGGDNSGPGGGGDDHSGSGSGGDDRSGSGTSGSGTSGSGSGDSGSGSSGTSGSGDSGSGSSGSGSGDSGTSGSGSSGSGRSGSDDGLSSESHSGPG